MLELGQDYMRAGLFDRAENLFQELVEMQTHNEAALRHLLAIYQHEKEWENAIGVALRLQRANGAVTAQTVAHFYCELAELQLARNDLDAAQALFKRALTSDACCVRATLSLAGLSQQMRQYEAAVALYQQVEQQDPDYLPEIIEPLRECLLTLARPEVLKEYLRALGERHPAITPQLLLTELISAEQGAVEAAEFLIRYLERQPSVRGLEYWLALRLGAYPSAELDALRQAHAILVHLLAQRPRYRCKQCGYATKTLHWQCPGCKEWGSIRPLPDVLCEER
jgi:lipopolysaccharide biosynthesis regulator YciM